MVGDVSLQKEKASVQFSSVQSLSRVRLFATPWLKRPQELSARQWMYFIYKSHFVSFRMGSSSFKNWKFSTLSKVHFFQIDIRAPDGFAQSVPLITAFCSLQVTDLLETNWLGRVHCFGFKTILSWVTYLQAKQCWGTGWKLPIGNFSSWLFLPQNWIYITPVTVNKHASTTVFAPSGQRPLNTRVNGSKSESWFCKDNDTYLSQDSVKNRTNRNGLKTSI